MAPPPRTFLAALWVAALAGCSAAPEALGSRSVPPDSGDAPETAAPPGPRSPPPPAEPGPEARSAPAGDERPAPVQKPRRPPDPAPQQKPAAAEGPETSPDPAPPRKAAAAPPGRAKPPARERSLEVKNLLLRLQSTPEEAGKAYREIWEVPKSILPKLILEVTSDEPSSLRELAVLILEKDRMVQVDSKDGTVAYDIPGMGNVKYDDIIVGQAPRGLKVILRRLRTTFPVGAVVRAGLLNRFRSTDYPPGSDITDPVGWWQRYYERVRAGL